MKLHYRKTGEGKPLILLHGLFGSADNLTTAAKAIAEEGFACYLVDQRNHGRSPHSFDFTYEAMAEDLRELLEAEELSVVDLLGHSMGAKAIMFFARKYSRMIKRMIVVDMAPRYYAPHHQQVIAAIHAVEPSTIATRAEAEVRMRTVLNDEGVIQFLLKNLYRNDQGNYAWRFGLDEIEKNIEEVGKALPMDKPINVPTLFLKGEKSDYLTSSDKEEILKVFPEAQFKSIAGAGHWVHAEQPEEFLQAVLDYLL